MPERLSPKRLVAAARRFVTETRASLTVELVLILPLVIWALVASFTFYDAFRKKTLAQSAAYHVADVISRRTAPVSPEYLESMNDVVDFLTQGKFDTGLRVSSLRWHSELERVWVNWSYGARGIAPLPANAVTLLSEQDYAALAESMGADWENSKPDFDLHSRIPPILTGERLILIETFAQHRSLVPNILGLGTLGDARLTNIAIARPRFTPIINFTGDMQGYPDDDIYDEGSGLNDNPNVDDVDLNDPCFEEAATLPGGVVVYENDFTTGNRSDWSGVSNSHFMHNVPHVGSMIGLFGKDAHKPIEDEIEFEIKLAKKDNQFALVEFDLIILGNWAGYNLAETFPEGEFFTLFKDKRAISTQAFKMNPTGPFACTRKTVTPRDKSHYTTWMHPVDLNVSITGGPHNDQIWRVTTLVERPEDKFKFHFGARLKDGFPTKAFAISNFKVTALEGKYTGTNFFPRNGDRDRDDPYDGFGYYKKCMDTRHGSKTIGATNPDLDTSIRYRVEARGHERFRNCVDFFDESGPRISASPTLELRYFNMGAYGIGNRLRIRTDDNNNGNSCRSHLLIEDPNGDLIHNLDISDSNRNAQIELGVAASGTYHIWVGRVSGRCPTDLVIEKY